jgi:3-oxoacyl-[acyl-carrier protein] reductase
MARLVPSPARSEKLQQIRRVGHVDEIADACIYLANAGFVTGQVLHVNGGAGLF